MMGVLALEPGLAKASLAAVDPCLGRRTWVGRLLSSEQSEESSYPFMMPWQGLQTRKEPDCPNWTPDIREVHLESNIWPHVPGLYQCPIQKSNQ